MSLVGPSTGRGDLYHHKLELQARTGVTNDRTRRIVERRLGLVPGFHVSISDPPSRLSRGVPDVQDAIAREKQIHGWDRAKRVALIDVTNPTWEDYGAKWMPAFPRKADPSLRSG